MSQIVAIFLDAYRELNARRMFWITLVISALVVAVLLMVGLTENHELKFMFWDLPIPIPPEMTLGDLLKATYVSIGVNFWLTWAAAILALISTASIFPDFVSSGAIDLVLAKPISRLKLFFLKYLSGLLFVALQVGAFSVAAFVLIGLRAGEWEPGLFIAVPIVVVFFSYLFCVCALIGIQTRSTIAALLLTVLFWLLLFGVNSADKIVSMPYTANQVYVEKLQQRLEAQRHRSNPDAKTIGVLELKLKDAEQAYSTWRKWYRMIVGVKTALPKTEETIKLLERSLMDSADLPEGPEDEQSQRAMMPFMTSDMYAAGVRAEDIYERIEQVYRARSLVWVVGTSLAFEAAVLAIASVLFLRRDY
jgi:ABC-type transport system involved in multi-copper enzyme maturation permease subunit